MPQVLIDFPARSVTDSMCSETMNLAARKHVRHQSIDLELFGPSTTVTALTKDIHIVRGATGTLVGLQATINGTIATGTDRTVTVDLHKSTGGGAFATALSSTIEFDDASTLRTAVAAVFSNTSLVAGDMLRLVITVAGSDAAQAVGLFVGLVFEETYS